MHQGQFIREYLKEKGIAQKHVATALKKSTATMADILNREVIQIDLVKNIADIINYNLFAEFYPQYMVQTSQESNNQNLFEGDPAEHIKEKYILQGRVEQLEKMLAGKLINEIKEEILHDQEEVIEELSNHVKKLNAKLEQLSNITTASGSSKAS